MSRVEVIDYNPEWPGDFETIRSLVWPAVRDVALNLEHVGSTAVPGLSAKPVVDACIVVASRAAVPEAIAALASIGYLHSGFRDFLRAHPDAARQYGDLKAALARRFPEDIDRYIAGKTAFVLGILERIGLSKDELAEIARINQMENLVRPHAATPSDRSDR